MLKSFAIGAALAVLATPALASPGVAQKIYGATVEKGVSEVELRYGRLTGGLEDGGDRAVIELSHGFSERFYGAVIGELSRDARANRTFDAFAFEGIVPIARVRSANLGVAVYGEYGVGFHGNPDHVETKLLLQHTRGAFDGRLNIILEKDLRRGELAEYGYAASADWSIAGDVRLGLTAFGDVGDTKKFGGRREHFVGPVVKAEIEHFPGGSALEIEAGYLRPFGAARDITDGQLRLLLSLETRF